MDRGPLPEVVEDASERAWREFDACSDALEARAHARRSNVRGLRRHPVRSVLHVEDVMHFARQQDRVCPAPGVWLRLHRLLSGIRGARGGDAPPAPVNLLEWTRTTDFCKRQRLREQAMWAQRYRALEAVDSYLRHLPERDWHHIEVAGWPRLQFD